MRWSKLHSYKMFAAGGAVCIAFILDRVGEPPVNWHPVVWYGKVIRRLERAAPDGHVSQFLYGIAMLLLAAPVALFPSMLIHRLAERMRVLLLRRCHIGIGSLLYAVIEGCALKTFFALRMLADAGRAVRLALEQDDLLTARHALQNLVSRDRSQLTTEQAAAAAIESLAENLSDSLVAPLFYYAIGGLPAAAAYRLFNTFDSMLGYHGRYEYLGKAAARLDDLLNLLPSRLTALLIILNAPLFGGNRHRAWHIWRRDAHKTASPNAGQPMAAAAGALGVQLEKVDHYVLGNREKDITAHDIKRAEHMVWRIGGTVILLTALLKLFGSVVHE